MDFIRELPLVEQGTQCYVNFFDPNMASIYLAQEAGKQHCANQDPCNSGGIYCALETGRQVAMYVMKGQSLKSALIDLADAPFIKEEYWNSLDGKEFSRNQGKAKFLRDAEGFARVVLGIDPFESVFNPCGTCEGSMLVETVTDSIHEGYIRCAGSGRVKRRDVEYCPTCEPVPQGGIIHGDPDSGEDEFFRRLSRKD